MLALVSTRFEEDDGLKDSASGFQVLDGKDSATTTTVTKTANRMTTIRNILSWRRLKQLIGCLREIFKTRATQTNWSDNDDDYNYERRNQQDSYNKADTNMTKAITTECHHGLVVSGGPDSGKLSDVEFILR